MKRFIYMAPVRYGVVNGHRKFVYTNAVARIEGSDLYRGDLVTCERELGLYGCEKGVMGMMDEDFSPIRDVDDFCIPIKDGYPQCLLFLSKRRDEEYEKRMQNREAYARDVNSLLECPRF